MTDTTLNAEQLDALLDRVKAHRTDANLHLLRKANGITTTGIVTAEVARIIKLRSRQGYSMSEVALMVGVSRSTCFDVKSGRRGVSGRPGCLGNPFATTFIAAIDGAVVPM